MHTLAMEVDIRCRLDHWIPTATESRTQPMKYTKEPALRYVTPLCAELRLLGSAIFVPPAALSAAPAMTARCEMMRIRLRKKPATPPDGTDPGLKLVLLFFFSFC